MAYLAHTSNRCLLCSILLDDGAHARAPVILDGLLGCRRLLDNGSLLLHYRLCGRFHRLRIVAEGNGALPTWRGVQSSAAPLNVKVTTH